MAAAAGELAAVFLETSLGTRFVVSFPASVTTVADLKRQVTVEHAACFPQSGPIAVESLKVKHDGSLFHLTDSMFVEDAFRWVQGPWNLLVEARELGPHPPPRDDADCGAGGSEQNPGNPVISDPTQNMSRPAVSHGGNLAIGDGVSDTPLLNQLQLDENHEVAECSSHQLEDGNTVPQDSSDDLYLAAGVSCTPSMDQHDHGGVAKHAMGQQIDGIVKTVLQECSDRYLPAGGSDNEKNAIHQQNSDLHLVSGESDSAAKNLQDNSHEDVEHAFSLCKDANAKIMFQGSSSLDAPAGEHETPSSLNQQDNSYSGVKHASGQHKNGNVKALSQENSDPDVVGTERETPPMNQLDKSYESVKHSSGQCEDGNVNTMPEESPDFDAGASKHETPPLNPLDKSHEGVTYALGQHEDGTVNILLQEGSDLDESAAAKGNDLMRDQQQDVIAEPRAGELFQNQKEDKNDESIVGSCDANISFLASSTVNIKLAEENRRIEPEKLNSNAMEYSHCSHDLGEKPSHDLKEPWTSEVCNGEPSSSVSDIPPCVHSRDRNNSSNREVNASNEDEPQAAGLYSGERSFRDAHTRHCVESMKEGNKRQTCNDQFLKKREYEGTEHESCSKRRRHRVLTVRKVSMSKAAKIFGVRC